MYASTEGAVIENKNGDDGIQFRVKTAGEAMRIDGGTGQVGIGTSSPSSLLHVAGTSGTLARIVGTSASSDVRLLFDAGGTTGQIQYAGASHASLADTLSLVTQADIRTVHAGSQRVTIKSDGDVGIGSTAPTNILELKKSSATAYDSSAKQDGGARLSIFNSNNTTSDTFADIHFQCHSTSPGEARIGMRLPSVGNSELFFITEGSATLAQRMFLNSEGNLIIGTTSSNPVNIADHRLVVELNSSTSGIAVGADGLVDTRSVMSFYNDNGTVGSITTNASSTAFNTSSDYRLKENVDYTWDATTRLKQLKPARFNFIADKDTTLDGFLAHEVSSIVPEAITGEKDGEQMQGIDQSKLVPLLVKTIQELEARVTALES